VCAIGYKCVGDDAGAMSCESEKVSGEACTFGRRECAGFCTLGGVCDVVAAEGERCGFIRQEPDGPSEASTCGAGLFCQVESTDPQEAFCRNQVPLGETCPNGISGSACQEAETVTYCATDTSNECSSCGG
jgi:hypothetical protein